MPAIVPAAPAIVLTARVLLGERVGVGEDEDGIDADAEHEVETDHRQDGRLLGAEWARVEGEGDGEGGDHHEERCGGVQRHAQHGCGEEPDEGERGGDEADVVHEVGVKLGPEPLAITVEAHLDTTAPRDGVELPDQAAGPRVGRAAEGERRAQRGARHVGAAAHGGVEVGAEVVGAFGRGQQTVDTRAHIGLARLALVFRGVPHQRAARHRRRRVLPTEQARHRRVEVRQVISREGHDLPLDLAHPSQRLRGEHVAADLAPRLIAPARHRVHEMHDRRVLAA
mmetsp:Transcript_37327/g.87867  ORF Transcript_37327/g.87867 Transcript_37327/m.87867 type:complete len:283 (-) Transcript_37327:64-912(-)